jgi:isoquinoline 1-oxidoreductase beta subunit
MSARLSRREALAGAGALVIGAVLPLGRSVRALAQAPAPVPTDPNVFLRIAEDDSVTLLVKGIEFGQGISTGFATVVAEELDADWSQMRAEGAPADAARFGSPAMGGMQGVGGSMSMASGYEQMRKVGATARALLVTAAAERWGVAAGEIAVDKGVVRHEASGRESRFGALAAAAAALPRPKDVTLKDPAAFRLIGRDKGVPRIDGRAKSTGAARFAIDETAPGLLHVVVARPPRFGARVASFDPAPALAVPGVVAVRRLSGGIAVYAKSTWPALKGRAALAIEWDESKAETRGTDEMAKAYVERARGPLKVTRSVGEIDRALADPAATVIEADYVFPYLAHAPMEPLTGFLAWSGEDVLCRMGTQLQTIDHAAIAKVFGLPLDKVTLETLLAGGSFGRRAQIDAQFAVELSEAAKAIGPGKPVKLIWTREDDIAGGYYRPFMVHHMRGAVKDGAITGWSDSVFGQSFIYGSAFESFGTAAGYDKAMVEGSEEPPYALPAFRCSVGHDPTPVPSLWWRSVGHTHTAYAVETFVDRLLEEAGQDRVAGRLALLGDSPRAAAVLRAVAAMAKWSGPGPKDGIARGVAVAESFGSFVAQIAEVSLAPNGEPRVRKVWCAVDCGVAVNPDMIRAQVEGGIGFATGHALYAEVPLVGGVPAVSNFHDYRSLRIDEMPDIEVRILASAAPPTGIGEPGVPPCAPAIANALSRLTGERPTRLPMVRPKAPEA